jgi:hypothetical protein
VTKFDCPRCQAPTEQDLYGPCASCRDALRTTMTRVAEVVEVDQFAPKMHVVPNQIATKE